MASRKLREHWIFQRWRLVRAIGIPVAPESELRSGSHADIDGADDARLRLITQPVSARRPAYEDYLRLERAKAL